MNYDFIIHTDGGGNVKTKIASACIVHHVPSNTRHYVLAYLGEGTNNEAEIAGCLLGLSVVHTLRARNQNLTSDKNILWISDSEYALNTAKDYIFKWQENGWIAGHGNAPKNLGLWKSYLHLKKDLKIQSEHTFAHKEDLFNNVCDNACTWARKRASSYLHREFKFGQVEISYRRRKKILHESNWVLIDGTFWINKMRQDDPTPNEARAVIDLFLSAKNS